VICDSAPLGAGIDPFALGTATENLLLVLRSGSTDRKLAQAKLAVLDRLPVRVVGAVLNGFKTDGVYKYYSYISGYSMEQESEDDGPIAANGARITRGL
jgi:Mrp family chromosome partitioning ATPase